MDDILANPVTKSWITAYINRPSSSLLIKTNNDSVTADKIVKYIHKSLVHSKAPLFQIYPDGNSIKIEQIRQLQHSLTLIADKSTTQVSRMAVVNSANLLTVDSQNALLKLIEELPKRTVLCLVADNTENLLETVLSRCFSIEILPVSKAQAYEYAETKEVSEDIAKRAYVLSEGNAGQYTAILKDGFTDVEAHIENAKKFISSNKFDRQKLLSELYKDKDSMVKFIDSLELITKTAMRSSKGHESKQRWRAIYKETIAAKLQISSNVSPKLALLRLSLEI